MEVWYNCSFFLLICIVRVLVVIEKKGSKGERDGEVLEDKIWFIVFEVSRLCYLDRIFLWVVIVVVVVVIVIVVVVV